MFLNMTKSVMIPFHFSLSAMVVFDGRMISIHTRGGGGVIGRVGTLPIRPDHQWTGPHRGGEPTRSNCWLQVKMDRKWAGGADSRVVESHYWRKVKHWCSMCCTLVSIKHWLVGSGRRRSDTGCNLYCLEAAFAFVSYFKGFGMVRAFSNKTYHLDHRATMPSVFHKCGVWLVYFVNATKKTCNTDHLFTVFSHYRVTNNCPRTFNFTLFDPDGDKVRCRHPTVSSTYECGICSLTSGLSLDEVSIHSSTI